MFILDSLMISGIRWALQTTLTAAEAEMNDDSALREQLLEAEMRREMGEISDEEFRTTEADLLARIREIRERREGTAPLEFGAQPIEKSADSTYTVEAELSGDFHEPAEHLTVPAGAPPSERSAGGAGTSAPGVASRRKRTKGAARTAPAPAAKRTRTRTARAKGTSRTTRTARTSKA